MRTAGGGAVGRREGPPKLRLIGAAALFTVLLPVSACGGSPPQIIDYAPLRGALDVSTAAPVRITFDHDVDRASVASRLRLVPATNSTVLWVNSHELLLQHTTLKPSTTYQVILEAGYRDVTGNANTLRHHWSFATEPPPRLASSTPGDGDLGVDPAAYFALDFTHDMDANSLTSAITLNPSVPVDVRLDPNDNRRAIIAPSELLAPDTSYQIAVDTAALDADGNQLDRDQTIDFTTGSVRGVHGFITFAVQNPDGSPGGAWIVDDQGFPRQLYNAGPVHSFGWSPAGDRLLVQGDNDSWYDVAPGAGDTTLPFKATWASALASGLGYVYIDESHELRRLAANGSDQVIASDVGQAAVAPNGLRVAFVEQGEAASAIWGYDVGLHARYELALDTAPISDVTWAPAGNRIAYLRTAAEGVNLRVRNLSGAASTTTVATGDMGAPSWLADSLHVVAAVSITTSTGVIHKAFVLNVVTPPQSLAASTGLPSDPTIDVSSPVPSPDGHQIAFINNGQVWLMNADGTRPTPLTKLDPASFPYSCRMPAWTRT